MHGSLYDRIAEEIAYGQIDKGLWTEAFAITNGDERLTRSQYIKLRVRRLRSMGVRNVPGRYRSAKRSGAFYRLGEWVDSAFGDLWTGWIWGWTFLFALLTETGVLSLIVKFSLRLFDDGLIVWPLLTVGSAFMTCFLFQRGVHRLFGRFPTPLFYAVELAWVGAVAWMVSRSTDPSMLSRLPRAVIPELVYLVVRFLHSADPMTNLLSAAMFFLPVYGGIVLVRQKMI